MATPISLPKGYQRLSDFPLDASSVFDNFAALEAYAATNGTAYAGQICAVKDTGLVYVIRADKSLSEVGATPDIGDISGLQGSLDEKQFKTIYSETAPSSPFETLRWVDTTTLTAYEFYNGAWVEMPD